MKVFAATIFLSVFLSSCGINQLDDLSPKSDHDTISASNWWPACTVDPTGDSGNCVGSSEIGNSGPTKSGGGVSPCGTMDVIYAFTGSTTTTNEPFRGYWFTDACGNTETGFVINPDTGKEKLITVPGAITEIDIR